MLLNCGVGEDFESPLDCKEIQPVRPKEWDEKGMREDEMVGWHHQLDGHEFQQSPGVGDGQGSLACCRPWDCPELDTTELLN